MASQKATFRGLTHVRSKTPPKIEDNACQTGGIHTRNWLTRLGGFDIIFGRGYGEEVDWCRRASAAGGHHVAVPDLFVEHRGGASFGSEKLALVQENNAVISARYPDYDRMVQDFIRSDPLITPRLMAAFLWADSLPNLAEIPVYIAHSMGGGAENYLQTRVAAAPVSVVLRFGGAFRCRIELNCPAGRMSANTDDLDLVLRMTALLTRRRIIYSCAVGDSDLTELPGFLRALARSTALEVLFHDYLALSPSYTLLDADGGYRGVPDPDYTDPAHSYRTSDGRLIGLREWRDLWAPVIAQAVQLTVFSASSVEILSTAYPQAKGRITIRPHELGQAVPRLQPPDSQKKVIGVLGAIGPQKGAGVVTALAHMLKGRQDIGLALIGRIAPGYPLGRHVAQHGAYSTEDIPALAARYRITHWLIPSIWPETFSYTVHECLATGLPVLAFDLGAQGAAVEASPNGCLLPWQGAQSAPDILAQIVLQAVTQEGQAA